MSYDEIVMAGFLGFSIMMAFIVFAHQWWL